MSQWKDDVTRAILDIGTYKLNEQTVRQAIDLWAPLTVDEAEAELVELDELTKQPLAPEKIEESVRYVMERAAEQASVSVDRIKTALAKERFYLHWLLHAYETINRGGWEKGYTHKEMSTKLLNVLWNAGLHPTNDRAEWRKLAKEKFGCVPPTIKETK